MPGVLNVPETSPASDALDLGWRALRSLFPNLTDPRTYQPLPPPAWTPTPEGKLPSADRDPRVEGAAGDLVNLALMLAPMPGLGVGTAAARWLPRLAERGVQRAEAAAETMASRSPLMYDPPAKPARPFAADYPQEAAADAAGRLTRDIEGRPLGASYIAGRRVVGGPDEPLSPAEVVAAATQAAGRNPEAVAANTIGGDAGRVIAERDRRSGQADYRLLWNRGLSPLQAERVIAHEVGHLIDDLAGRIPTTGLNTELRQVYNTLNTGWERTRHLTGPQHLGYRGDDVPKELMAEALRAYMSNPNYLKTVAPRTAAAIREAVNSHPSLSRIVQLNSLAGMLGAGGIGGPTPPGAFPAPKPAGPAFF
jgi:hypothetical protein